MGHHHEQTIPPWLLKTALALMVFSILAAVFGRMTGIGVTRLSEGVVVQARELRFQDGPGGGIRVTDAHTAAPVAVVTPDEQGFVSGVLRGFARARRLADAEQDLSLTLTRWSDGRLSLHDPVTEHSVALEAFGRSNAAAFARLLVPAGKPSTARAASDDPRGPGGAPSSHPAG